MSGGLKNTFCVEKCEEWILCWEMWMNTNYLKISPFLMRVNCTMWMFYHWNAGKLKIAFLTQNEHVGSPHNSSLRSNTPDATDGWCRHTAAKLPASPFDPSPLKGRYSSLQRAKAACRLEITVRWLWDVVGSPLDPRPCYGLRFV